MPPEGIRVERQDKTAVVVIDRPSRLNTFNDFMLDQLDAATHAIEKEPPRAVIITGAGEKAFSAGFDINPDNPMVLKLAEAVEKKDRAPAEQAIYGLRRVIDAFASLPVPIIAALNGLAYGGGAELAARCDIRVMDPAAVICFSEVTLGLMPDWGGGPTLVRLVGSAAAAELILTARRIAAEEALRLGLANRISPPGQSLAEALEIAGMIAKNGPRAVREALHVIRQTRNLSLEKALALEAERAVSLIVSGECLQGVAAFLEKKRPEFADIE